MKRAITEAMQHYVEHGNRRSIAPSPPKRATVAELRNMCEHLLKQLRLAHQTSNAYRDAHSAYQRWAARLAPHAIGDEAKRTAIEDEIARLRAALKEGR